MLPAYNGALTRSNGTMSWCNGKISRDIGPMFRDNEASTASNVPLSAGECL
jgi:hypothetical protein